MVVVLVGVDYAVVMLVRAICRQSEYRVGTVYELEQFPEARRGQFRGRDREMTRMHDEDREGERLTGTRQQSRRLGNIE